MNGSWGKFGPYPQATMDPRADVQQRFFRVHGPSLLAGFVLSLVVVACLWVSTRLLHGRRRRLVVASEAAKHTTENIKRVFKGRRLPFWVKNPEVLSSNVAFINTTLRHLWPHIDRAASDWAFKDSALEKLMNSQTFWKPSWMRATGIILQAIMLGEVPLHVEGIKVYEQQPGRSSSRGIVMDIAFSWKSNMVVKIAMKTLEDIESMSLVDRILGCVYSSLKVSAVVRNLVARGMARVTINPLMDSLPVVGGIHVCFLEVPEISYDVTSFGAKPLLIPGLEVAVRSFVEDVALDPFVFPDGITLDIAKLLGMDHADVQLLAEGVLCVTVISARGIPTTDLFGGSDPFCSIFLEASKRSYTSVKSNTLNPKWNEEFDFLVFDSTHQRLHLMLYDSETIGGDRLVGTAAVRLGDIDWVDRAAEIEVEVDVVFGNRKDQRRRIHPNQTGGPQFGRVASSASETRSEVGHQSGFVYTRDVQRDAPSQLDQLKDDIRKVFLVGSSSKCRVSLKLEYLPFNRRSEEEQSARSKPTVESDGTCTKLSARAQRFLDGGMLHVHVCRAFNLRASAQLTKRYSIVVRVRRGIDGSIVSLKTNEKSGMNAVNPSLDVRSDILLDSETAHAEDAIIEVEIVVQHFVRKSTSRGMATVSLSSVIDAGRLATRLYELRNPDTGERVRGELELELAWASTL